ncbi:MAG: hypothetical protein AW07_00242 [Candidatus Accumulibacter sp. SK-11]|nr:MAG: hypothetical protein AW07_00242 [Candidatus Accumulibacter sp. SK-11]
MAAAMRALPVGCSDVTVQPVVRSIFAERLDQVSGNRFCSPLSRPPRANRRSETTQSPDCSAPSTNGTMKSSMKKRAVSSKYKRAWNMFADSPVAFVTRSPTPYTSRNRNRVARARM